jgi:hypothetical protein
VKIDQAAATLDEEVTDVPAEAHDSEQAEAELPLAEAPALSPVALPGLTGPELAVPVTQMIHSTPAHFTEPAERKGQSAAATAPRNRRNPVAQRSAPQTAVHNPVQLHPRVAAIGRTAMTPPAIARQSLPMQIVSPPEISVPALAVEIREVQSTVPVSALPVPVAPGGQSITLPALRPAGPAVHITPAPAPPLAETPPPIVASRGAMPAVSAVSAVSAVLSRPVVTAIVAPDAGITHENITVSAMPPAAPQPLSITPAGTTILAAAVLTSPPAAPPQGDVPPRVTAALIAPPVQIAPVSGATAVPQRIMPAANTATAVQPIREDQPATAMHRIPSRVTRMPVAASAAQVPPADAAPLVAVQAPAISVIAPLARAATHWQRPSVRTETIEAPPVAPTIDAPDGSGAEPATPAIARTAVPAPLPPEQQLSAQQSPTVAIASDLVTIAVAPRPEAPQDFAALVDRLVQAREAAAPPQVSAAIAHADFGQISLHFRHDDGGLTVGMTSADPGFAAAAQAAIPAALHTPAAAESAGNNANGSSTRQDGASQSGMGSSYSQPRGGNSGAPSDGGDLRPRANASPQAETQQRQRASRSGIFA